MSLKGTPFSNRGCMERSAMHLRIMSEYKSPIDPEWVAHRLMSLTWTISKWFRFPVYPFHHLSVKSASGIVYSFIRFTVCPLNPPRASFIRFPVYP